MGQSPSSASYNDRREGLPFFQGKAEFGSLYPTVRKWCSEPLRIAKAGDILLSVRAPVGPTNLAAEDCCIGRGLAAIRAREPFDQKYILHFFRNIQTWLTAQGTGTTFAAISGDFVRQIEVAIAPLPEQKRIADKLDALLARVDACRERLDRVPTILKRFRQSVLAAATTGELTREWREEQGFGREWRPAALGSLLTDVRYGTAKKCAYEPRKTPVLRIPNVVAGTISHDDLKYADFDQDEKAKLALAPGDLLMIRSNGSVGLVGRTALVSEREAGFLYAGYLIRLRPDAAQATSAYLSLFLASPASRTRIASTARSTTGVNNINAEEIRNFPIAVPSLAEQSEIVRRVGKLFAIAGRLDDRILLAQAIVQRTTPSALTKAFRGDLVQQDPNDEPAIALIKRVRDGLAKSRQRMPESALRKPRPREDIRNMVKKLIDVLAEAGDWMTAQEAFRGCGVSEGAKTELVEAIYAELRQLERDNRVAVEPVRNARGVKVHDRLKLIAKR